MTKIFKVDGTRCVKCGACAESCPVKVIGFKPGSIPLPFPWAAKACINCGHCVAVCPHGCMTHVNIPVEQCVPIRKELEIPHEALVQYFKSRRSIRVYRDEPVSRDVVKDLIELASYAPTGHNSQSVAWHIADGKAEIAGYRNGVIEWMKKSVEENTPMAQAIGMKGILMGAEAGNDLILRNAPCVVIAHAHKDDRMAPMSAAIAMAHLELAARSFTLGACWAGYLDLGFKFHEPLRRTVPLPEGHVPLCSMMLGRPKYEYHRIPIRKKPSIT